MPMAIHAANDPTKIATLMLQSGETLTYGELNERSIRLARLFAEAGLVSGDVVALFMENNIRYHEVYWAAVRSGMYLCAVNKYLTAEEAAYIVNDSGAKALVTSVGLADAASAMLADLDGCPIRLVVDGLLAGYVPYEDEVANEEELKTLATEIVQTYNDSIDALRFDTALEALWELVKAGNKYIDTSEPWKLNREGDLAKLRTAKRVVLEICYLAATLLLPVIPNKSRELLTNLGRNEFAAKDYLKQLVSGEPVGLDALPAGIPLTYGDPLFPRHKELPEAIQALFEAPKVAEKAAEPEPEVKLSKRERKEAERAERKAKELAYQQPIDVDHFKHVQLRAGIILSAEAHPNADKLLVVQVDIGEDEPRQIVAGIATKFSPDEVVGKKVVVVSNLQPANLRGVESQGMILAAGAKDVVDLVSVDAEPGEVVR